MMGSGCDESGVLCVRGWAVRSKFQNESSSREGIEPVICSMWDTALSAQDQSKSTSLPKSVRRLIVWAWLSSC